MHDLTQFRFYVDKLTDKPRVYSSLSLNENTNEIHYLCYYIE